MKIFYLRLFACLLLFGTVVFAGPSFGQSRLDTTQLSILALEKQIVDQSALTKVQAQLTSLRQQATHNGDNILLARVLFNQLRIRDQRTEDSLYFRNSAFMDTLLADNTSSSKLKAILFLMRAKRISMFDGRQLKFNRATYRSKLLKIDYASLTLAQRTSLVAQDLDSALTYQNPQADGSPFLWLSSNPDVFLFKPNFGAIVLAEKVNLLVTNRYISENQQSWGTDLLSLSSEQFRTKLAQYSDKKPNNNVIAAYYNWLNYHRDSPANAAFVESLIRKYIYLHTNADTIARKSYIEYLQAGTDSKFIEFKAHSVYQLCLILNEDGNKYSNLWNDYRYQLLPGFNPTYQFDPAKALALYTQHQALMQQYPIFNQVLEVMVAQIKTKAVSMVMDHHQLPEEEIPVRLIYKNTDTLFYRIIKTTAAQAETQGNGKVAASAELLDKHAVAQGSFALPLPMDHNWHATFLKLPALPAGHYRLLFTGTAIAVEGNELNQINFEVTQIAAINSSERIFVLNRKTGFPLIGARIKAFKKNVVVRKGIASVVGSDGYITVGAGIADRIDIIHDGDTTLYKFAVQENELPDELYSKEEYDDLTEFYDDKLKLEIFTDRSIYRPGQTVHYKAVFLTNNPKNGNVILFNRENLGGGIFNNRLKKWLKDGNDELLLKDPFGKKIDSITFKINEFGSFSGSFVLPKSAATGDWQIEGMPDADYSNEGNFSVEEYKRPTIVLTVARQKKVLELGKPFTFKLKLRSLSGGELGNVPVNYTINRSGSVPSKKRPYGEYQNVELVKKTGFTDDKGELELIVADPLIANELLSDSVVWNYSYSIDATAVDLTGESTQISDLVNISSRPIKISIPVDPVYDSQKFPPLNVSTIADFEGSVGKKVNVKLYQINHVDQPQMRAVKVDQWYYPQANWNKWFPNEAVLPEVKEVKTLVLDTVIDTEKFEKLTFGKGQFSASFYEIVATVKGNGRTVGQSNFNFRVFDSKSDQPTVNDLSYMPINSGKPGDKLNWYSTGKIGAYVIYHLLYVDGKTRKKIRESYQTFVQKSPIQVWQYEIPANATGELIVNRISIAANQLEKQEKRVYISPALSKPLDIVVEKYRTVLAPGAKETFTLSIRTKNDKIAAELMTTLYDAALDKLREHHWRLPNTDPRRYYLSTSWNNGITTSIKTGDYTGTRPISLSALGASGSTDDGYLDALSGKLPGISVSEASGLNEVVIVHGVDQKQITYASASVVSIRGISSLKEFVQPLVIIDGEVFTGDLNTITPSLITQAMVLKGADASALYGARAAQGVLIMSTKGPIVLPEIEAPVVKIRKNFQETAFFYPQLHIGKNGEYSFSFTMPETTTEWNWKMLAHTRGAKFAYLEKKLQTQLNLMVQPNVPRLLYQGDEIQLKSRITNLDTIGITGTASCKIEDAVTGADLTAMLTAGAKTVFKLDRKSTGSVSFTLRIPEGQLNPLKIVVMANSGYLADAEEHLIPVLSPKILVRQSQPLNLDQQVTATVPTIRLPEAASLYGASLAIAQKPQAALLYALPWLANYAYDCAEQTFNKLRAQVTALRLMQKDTVAQRAFERAKVVNAQNRPKAESLPDELLEETMPWLNINNQATKQQQQLFKLLDTLKAKSAINKHLERLFKFQLENGGLTWFEGGKTNAYISAYVLAGFGQLKQIGWVAEAQQVKRQQELITRLLAYGETALNENATDQAIQLFQLYAASYWIKDRPFSPQYLEKATAILSAAWTKVQEKDLSEQALLVIATLRYTSANDPLHARAMQQLVNIRERAIEDEANGLRWKAIADHETLNTTAAETMALLAEAFEMSGKYKEVSSGISKWLLLAKQDEHWQSTKATAAAIELLQKENGSAFQGNNTLSVKLSNAALSVADGLLDGTPVAFAPIKQLPQTVNVQQQGRDAKGTLSWYYFAMPSNLDTLNKTVKISKELYVYDDSKQWLMVKPGQVLKVGDRIQVKLSVETNAKLKFVHLDDPRAAAFEPVKINSGYHYSDGISYYQSVRDTGSAFFTELIPSGITVITYELVVAQAGEFTNGTAKLQCMYQPSVTAYSNGLAKVKTN
jgi:hypothetical protein